MDKPIIGITCREEIISSFNCQFVHNEYYESVIKSGGSPLMLLPCYDDKILAFCDGFIITGGSYETAFDFYVLDYAKRNNKPILGICLGMQVMAMSDGTKLKSIGNLSHTSEEKYVHDITITKDSLLYSIIGKENISVNSRHKFKINELNNYKITSLAPDNVIESIELSNQLFHIGVEWHPETLYDIDDNSKRIFNKFISSCLKKV